MRHDQRIPSTQFEPLPPPPVDDDKLRRLRDGALRRLARGDDAVLAEMAREVLSGRMTSRDAAHSFAYRDALATAADKAISALRESQEEIRETAEARALDDLIEELERDEPEDLAPPPDQARGADRAEATEDDDLSHSSILQGPPAANRGITGQPPRRTRWTRTWK